MTRSRRQRRGTLRRASMAIAAVAPSAALSSFASDSGASTWYETSTFNACGMASWPTCEQDTGVAALDDWRTHMQGDGRWNTLRAVGIQEICIDAFFAHIPPGMQAYFSTTKIYDPNSTCRRFGNGLYIRNGTGSGAFWFGGAPSGAWYAGTSPTPEYKGGLYAPSQYDGNSIRFVTAHPKPGADAAGQNLELTAFIDGAFPNDPIAVLGDLNLNDNQLGSGNWTHYQYQDAKATGQITTDSGNTYDHAMVKNSVSPAHVSAAYVSAKSDHHILGITIQK